MTLSSLGPWLSVADEAEKLPQNWDFQFQWTFAPQGHGANFISSNTAKPSETWVGIESIIRGLTDVKMQYFPHESHEILYSFFGEPFWIPT